MHSSPAQTILPWAVRDAPCCPATSFSGPILCVLHPCRVRPLVDASRTASHICSASRVALHFFVFSFFFPFLFSFLWLHPQHIEVPRLGVALELHLLAFAMATATWDLGHVCELHHSSWQCRIPDSLIKAGDQTHILMGASWVHFCYTTMGTPAALPFDSGPRLTQPRIGQLGVRADPSELFPTSLQKGF